MAKKMLWVSRHPLTEAQKATVRAYLGPEDVKFIETSLVFPGDVKEAVDMIQGAVAEHNADILGVVCPSHVAIALYDKIKIPMVFFVNTPSARQKGVFLCDGAYIVKNVGYLSIQWMKSPIPVEEQEESSLAPEPKK